MTSYRRLDDPVLDIPWTDSLPPSPIDYPASATTVKTFQAEPRHRAIVIAMSPVANVTAFSVKGTGSQIAYVTTGAQPTSGLIIVPIWPVLESYFDVSLTVNATGPVHVFVVGVTETFPQANAVLLTGEDVTLGGVTAPQSEGTDPAADSTTYHIAADVWFRAGGGWTRWNSPASILTQGASVNAMPPIAPYLYNGTNFDAQRGVVDLGALITAAAAVTTQNSADQTNYNGRGLKVRVNTTVIGTGSITLHIQGKDSVGGAYYDLLVGAAIVTNTLNVYEIGPGLPATANVSANTQLPRIWRVQAVANNANAATYTVAAEIIP